MNDVGIDILPEAIAALESRDLFLAPEELPEFASRQFKSRQVHQRLRRLSTALSMSEFYQHVLHFAADFAIISVRSSSLADSEIPADRPSRSEKSRMKRALYRFEICCNMFKVGHQPAFHPREQNDIFFRCFSHWENEQLACIHDYFILSHPVSLRRFHFLFPCSQ
jgi:hypothetical protein